MGLPKFTQQVHGKAKIRIQGVLISIPQYFSITHICNLVSGVLASLMLGQKQEATSHNAWPAEVT